LSPTSSKIFRIRLNYHGSGLESSSLGILFLLVTLVVSFGAFNTGNNLLYLIVSALLSLLILSEIHARIILSGIDASLDLPAYTFAGDPLIIQSRVKNSKRFFASFGLSIDPTQSLPSSRLSFMFPCLLAKEIRVQRKVIRLTRRGDYACREFMLMTDYPFGFYRKFRTISCNRRLIVYPALREVPLFDAYFAAKGDGKSAGITGTGEEDVFCGVKEFIPGEDYHQIHWKISARSDRLMIKEFKKEPTEEMHIWLDTHVTPPSDKDLRDRFESMISAAAGLTLKCFRRHIPVLLSIPDPAKGHIFTFDTLEDILYCLATVEPTDEPDVYRLWHEPETCPFIFTINDPGNVEKSIPGKFQIVTCQEKGIRII